MIGISIQFLRILEKDGWDGKENTLRVMAQRYRKKAEAHYREYAMAGKGGDEHRRKAVELSVKANYIEDFLKSADEV